MFDLQSIEETLANSFFFLFLFFISFRTFRTLEGWAIGNLNVHDALDPFSFFVNATRYTRPLDFRALVSTRRRLLSL